MAGNLFIEDFLEKSIKASARKINFLAKNAENIGIEEVKNVQILINN